MVFPGSAVHIHSEECMSHILEVQWVGGIGEQRCLRKEGKVTIESWMVGQSHLAIRGSGDKAWVHG